MSPSVRAAGMLLWTLALLPGAFLAQPLGLLGPPGRRLRLRLLTALAALWFRGLLRCAAVEIHLPATLPRGAAMVTANHVTYLDVMVLGALRPARFVAKAEIARWPVIGSLARLAGTLFHTRGSARDVKRLTAEVLETLRAGVSVVLFPEGRCGDGTRLNPFHSGFLEAAVQGGVPCLPLYLHYELDPPTASPRRLVAWSSRESLFRHGARLLRSARVRVTVRIASPPLTDKDRKRLARRLYEATAAVFTPLRP